MPPYSYRPALGGRREYGGHTPSWQGRAVRGGSPRGGVSLGLRPLEPPRARGARYALGEVRLGEVRRRKGCWKRGLAGERVSRQAAEDGAGGQEGAGGQDEEKYV